MARITNKSNKAATDTNAPAKVARVAKGKATAQQAPAKAAKAAKGSTQQAPAKGKAKAAPASGQQARLRGQYAGKRVVITEAGKAANPRGLRGDRWAIVAKAKRTDDFLGKPYVGHDGTERPFSAAKFANFVERGYVELVD